MKKIRFIIPILFLILATILMESGSFLKKTYNGDKIPESLDNIINDINIDNWESAEIKASNIKTIFDKSSKLIQFSVERNEIFEFKYNLALLDGYIHSQDKSNVIAQVYLLKENWNELGS